MSSECNPFDVMRKNIVRYPDQDLNAFKQKKRKIDTKQKSDQRTKTLKKEMDDANAIARKLEKGSKKIDIDKDHSTKCVPKDWMVPEWPYSHTNTDDIDLQMIAPDYQDVSSYLVPPEFRQTFKLPIEKQARTNPYPQWPRGCKNLDDALEDPDFSSAYEQYKKGPTERSVKLPVIRAMCAPNNGSTTAVRFHGWKPDHYVPVADQIAKKILLNQFPEIKDYPYGNGTCYQLPQGLDPSIREAEWTKVRAQRNAKIARNRMAQQCAEEFKDALEREIQKNYQKELKWDTGDFTCATVVEVTPVLMQSVYGFDFDEQKLFFRIKYSLQRVTYFAKDLMMKKGFEVSGLFYQLRADQFYNAVLPPDLLFMIQVSLSGQAWFSLKAGTYKILTGSLPDEIYKRKFGVEDEEKDEEKGAGDGGFVTSDLGMKVIDFDEDMTEEEKEVAKHLADLELEGKEDDAEHEKLRKTWCRAEIDVHFKNIESHYQTKPSEKETKLMNLLKVDLDLVRETLARTGPVGGDEEKAVEFLLTDIAGRKELVDRIKTELDSKTRKPAKDPTDVEARILSRFKSDLGQVKRALEVNDQSIAVTSRLLTMADQKYKTDLQKEIKGSPKYNDPLWDRNANLSTLSWDLECSHLDPNRGMILSIGLVKKDLVTDVEKNVVCTWKIPKKKGVHDDNDPNDLKLDEGEILMFENEKDMIQYFAQLFRNSQFTKNCGYNIFKFDWPYIVRRAQILGITSFPLLSIYRECIRIKQSLFTSAAAGERKRFEVLLPGAITYDLYLWALSELKLKFTTLNAVAKHVVGGEKDDLHHTLINPMFRGSKADRERLMHYCYRDCKLVIDIIWFPKNALWMRNTEMCRVTGVVITTLIIQGQGVKTHVSLTIRMLRRGFLAPNKSKAVVNGEKDHDADGAELADEDAAADSGPGGEDEKYKGAGVIAPKIGYYNSPVSTEDFQSLYPSIMSAFNLCYSTLLQTEADRARLKEDDYVRIETVSGEHDEIITYFYWVKKHIRTGVVVDWVDFLLDQRNNKVKKELKEAVQEGKPTALLEARSTALKLANNSTYDKFLITILARLQIFFAPSLTFKSCLVRCFLPFSTILCRLPH